MTETDNMRVLAIRCECSATIAEGEALQLTAPEFGDGRRYLLQGRARGKTGAVLAANAGGRGHRLSPDSAGPSAVQTTVTPWHRVPDCRRICWITKAIRCDRQKTIGD